VRQRPAEVVAKPLSALALQTAGQMEVEVKQQPAEAAVRERRVGVEAGPRPAVEVVAAGLVARSEPLLNHNTQGMADKEDTEQTERRAGTRGTVETAEKVDSVTNHKATSDNKNSGTFVLLLSHNRLTRVVRTFPSGHFSLPVFQSQ
jgi:hypothetical protein